MKEKVSKPDKTGVWVKGWYEFLFYHYSPEDTGRQQKAFRKANQAIEKMIASGREKE